MIRKSKTISNNTDKSLKRKRSEILTEIKSENSKSKSNKLFNGTNEKNKILISNSSATNANQSNKNSQAHIVTTVVSSDKLIETMSRT